MARAWSVGKLDPQRPVEENARRILRVRMGELYAYAPIADNPEATEELHDMRIAAKRLRYTLELFREVFGEAGERNISRVKKLQEALGDLHDADVRIALIEDELAALAIEEAESLGLQVAKASSTMRRAVIAHALIPADNGARRGLLNLLARVHDDRIRHHQAFFKAWTTSNTDGMRQDLTALSSMPLDAVD